MILHLIIKEIKFRKLNFILALSAIALAVAFFVFFFTSNEASKRETTRLTRDMGFNLRIIPKGTDMNKFWTSGYSEFTMPEDYAERFRKFKDFSFAHVTATLQKKILWDNKEIILTGIAPEIDPAGRAAMAFIIKPGQVYIGSELARQSGAQQSGMIDILGKKFTIARILSETGSTDDIRAYGPLSEFQEILGMKGQINEIMALNCLCLSPEEGDPLTILRQQLDQVLPEAKVVMNTTIANAREKQRQMLEKYFSVISVFVVLLIAIWIGTLAMINTKDREQEIGVLHALGHSSGKILGIFLGKALIIGFTSAIGGYLLGSFLAMKFGGEIFKITADSIKPMYSLLLWSIIAAPAFSALSSFIPAIIAAIKDPVTVIRN
jgi:ABC-type lipoprotein release transport system permease subunit